VNAVQEAAFGLTKLPPRTMRLSISPAWFDFKKTGRDQIEFFIELAGLLPSDHFLDIACGVGRLAIPLSHFLDSQATYEGFDINATSIAWCKKHITTQHSNFNFVVADVKTTGFLEMATYTAENYVFQYSDDSFNFVYAGSIFTHLLPGGAKNYLEQTARVLKPGGRFVATWLIYNKDWAFLCGGSSSDPAKHWKHDYGDHRIKNDKNPEESVCYDVSRVRDLYTDANLRIIEPFRVDASYSPARIPSDRKLGMHLYYALSIIAVPS
jgi:SAM-dependent methyltransferase